MRFLSNIGTGLALALVGLPLAAVMTIFALPFWSFLEGNIGVESVGHSGPAPWCYVATYLAVIAVAVAGFGWRARRSREHN